MRSWGYALPGCVRCVREGRYGGGVEVEQPKGGGRRGVPELGRGAGDVRAGGLTDLVAAAAVSPLNGAAGWLVSKKRRLRGLVD
jgi:hypothetical protein